MRERIVAGNWKMNKTFGEGAKLMGEIAHLASETDLKCKLIVAPTYINIPGAITVLNKANIKLGAQNCHQEVAGAYTGEVSAPILRSIGVQAIILGHSERRQYFNESNELISQKMQAAFTSGMLVIWCCGEPLDVREANKQEDYVGEQLAASILSLSAEQLSQVVIAYEPIWAIGTGKTASSEQAQAMHQFIRKQLADTFGEEAANEVSILYGGSCKPTNAKELFAQPDIDGGLIGGASLVAEDFIAIAQSFE